MKFLIAFAFIAAASAASIVPIRLPEPMAPRFETPDLGLLIVPAEVMETVRIAELNSILAEIAPSQVKFIDVAVNADETPAETPVEAVKVVESVEDVAREADEGLAVKFVDVADNADETPAETPVEAVKVVESVEEVAREADAGLAVNFVDVAVNADDTPVEAVKVVELHEQVAHEADEGLAVKFVDVADNVDDTPVEAVKVVELHEQVAHEADDGLAVKFVEVAENQEIAAPLEVAEPIAQHDAVVVVEDALAADMPLRYPGKQYGNPLLRSRQ